PRATPFPYTTLFRSALLIPTDYSIEPRALHAALLAAATASRVRMLRARVDSVQVADARVTGLRLADGVELPADVVVVALGAWSGDRKSTRLNSSHVK